MPKPWIDRVKQSGQLTIFTGNLAGSWAHVFRQALHEFNTLCSAHRLGVRFIESREPAEKDDGANVSVQTADGTLSATFGNETRSRDFDGARLHGATLLFGRDAGVEKVFIFLPSQPQVSTPKGLRPAGPGVTKVIAAHELIHACGLDNSDHSNDDLFQGNPRVDAGDSAAGDKVLIGVGPKKMPPLYLSAATAKSIKDLWAR